MKSNPANGMARHFVLSFILPYMERQALHDKINFKLDYDSAANSPATQQDIAEYVCPSADSRDKKFATDYTALVDIHDANYCKYIEAAGLAPRKRPVHTLAGMLRDIPVKLANVRDGQSQTFLFFEAAGKPFHYLHGVLKPDDVVPAEEYRWASNKAYDIWGSGPGNADCGITTVMNCDNTRDVYSFHPGGAIFAFGDGSADFVSEDVEIDTFISPRLAATSQACIDQRSAAAGVLSQFGATARRLREANANRDNGQRNRWRFRNRPACDAGDRALR
jgi:prepilin-type processing-associated H-X9-DG protein